MVSFHEEDIDAAREIGTRLYYDHKLEPVGDPRTFALDVKAGQVGGTTVGVLQYHSEIAFHVPSLDVAYAVAVSLSGVLNLRVGQSDVSVGNGSAAILSPSSVVHGTGWSAGTERLALLKFNSSAVESELGRVLARDIRGPIDIQPPFRVDVGDGASWWRMARLLVAGLSGPEDLSWNPLMASSLESALTRALLLASDHPYRDQLHERARPIQSTVIRRAIAVIEERAHLPLTVPELAEASGCSVRALQVGFQRWVGMSPGQYIRRVRMDRVHRELLAASPDTTTVAEVANRWGVPHLGRFAAEYRKVYGVTPMRTLRDR